ncbi:MAG TPA: hypothetical protein VEC99_09710, partial [Clostridia bacterium]|nr:hypothetical protein [Clostridia bacterium]
SHHRERAGEVRISQEPDLQVYHGMRFGPPRALVMKSQTLQAGETALLALPRPPFDCVWRPNIGCEVPLTKLEFFKHITQETLHLREKWQIYPRRQGAVYNEWVDGAWITNATLHKAVQRTEASHSPDVTNQTPVATGFRR